jgi:hypothetical protein
MTMPQTPPSTDLEHYGLRARARRREWRRDDARAWPGDPGVSTMLSHRVVARTTIVVLCNQDRDSWAAVARLTKELGLTNPRDVAEAQG